MIAKDVLEPNPFAKAPLAEGGNPTAQEIYTGVGLALDRWEHCDISIATVYSALVKPEGSNHALMRAFGTISSPNAKREMTWEACDAFFASYPNDDLKKTTRHLLSLYRDAASRRNNIAHAMVMGEARYKLVDNKAVPLPTIWFLVPPLFATRKNEIFARGPKYRYSTREISHFTSCFEELGARASKLAQNIRSFYEALPEKHG